MSNGSFSALRANVADSPAVAPEVAADANNDAYGSLSGLGGPKKFKKKPVLVLDPEELERAHLMFQEASAEILGEEFKRPERPVAMLGLAPMDDEDATPEDMGEDDESTEDDESIGIVKTDAVLGMNKVRRELQDEADAFAMQEMELDLNREDRIFPNLPLQEDVREEEYAEAGWEPEEQAWEPEPLPEAAEPAYEEPVDEAVEEFVDEDYSEEPPVAEVEPPVLEVDDAVADTVAEGPEAVVKPEAVAAPVEPEKPALEALRERAAERLQASLEPRDEVAEQVEPGVDEVDEAPEPLDPRAPRIEDAPEERPASRYVAPFDLDPPRRSAETPVQDPVAALDEPEDDPAQDPWLAGGDESVESAVEAEFDHDEVDEPRSAEPVQPGCSDALASADSDPDLPEWAEAEDFGFSPAPPPRPRPEVHVEVYGEEDEDGADGFEFAAEDYDAEEYEEEAPGADALPMAELGASGNTTYFNDEEAAPVDGRAFMYAESPRGRTIHSLAEGSSNSLRAKLIREREHERLEAEARHGEGSLLLRFWNWLRGLFGNGEQADPGDPPWDEPRDDIR